MKKNYYRVHVSACLVLLFSLFFATALTAKTDFLNCFTGEIMLWPGRKIPTGWRVCRGQERNIHKHKELFKLIGKNFGGDGHSTFLLPNLRKKVHQKHLRYIICEKGRSFSSYPSMGGYHTLSGGSIGRTMGAILLTAGAFFSDQFKNCSSRSYYGGLLSINQNAALYSLLGTKFGGDGHVTVGLPNLEKETPKNCSYSICTTGTYPSRSDGFSDRGIGRMLLFTGWGGFYPDNYWTPCDGQKLLVKDYPELYKTIGTRFGGDGKTTFQIPDMGKHTPKDMCYYIRLK